MANMKLYMTPGSCTTGIHILLEEIGAVFEAYLVNLLEGDHKQPDYMAMNPKSTIPLLVREDGKAITEFQAIAYWLARRFPKAKLLPEDLDSEARVMETMDYVVGTIHMQGFARLFTTSEFCETEGEQEAIKAKGKEIINKGFGVINKYLQEKTKDKPYVAGDYSIADAALFYVEFWADKIGIPLPEYCQQHYQRMRERPAVQQVLLEEGYR
jgi:glutathione S-transferase